MPGEAELRAWLKPVLNAVSLLHDGGVWHQNIGPDSIVLTPVGPVLFGLGSAAADIAALEHTPAAALKPGFAAIEQYGNAAETKRGAWTDLYALAAVIYAAITGSAPAAPPIGSPQDPVRPLSVVAAGLYGERFLAAIDAAMAVEPERRPQDHQQFRALMGDIDSPEPLELAPPPRPDARALRRRRRRARDHRARPSAAADRRSGGQARGRQGRGRRRRQAGAAGTPRGRARRRRRHAVAAGGLRRRGSPAGRSRSCSASAPLYGLVAGTGALIGIAALALQFQARQAPRRWRPRRRRRAVPVAAPPPAPAAVAPPTPATTRDHRDAPPATTTAPIAAHRGRATTTATATADRRRRAHRHGAAPSPVAATAAAPPVAAPAASAAPPRARAHRMTSHRRRPPPSVRPAAPRSCRRLRSSGSPPAETNYFKRECK